MTLVFYLRVRLFIVVFKFKLLGEVRFGLEEEIKVYIYSGSFCYSDFDCVIQYI